MLEAIQASSIRFTHDGQDYTLFGTTQKTGYQRVQACAFEGVKIETKVACWRSGRIVWGDKRVVSVNQDIHSLTVFGGWHSQALYAKEHASMERRSGGDPVDGGRCRRAPRRGQRGSDTGRHGFGSWRRPR